MERKELEKALEGRTDRIGLNFKDVNNISFGALRTILRMIDVKHMSLFGFNLNNYVSDFEDNKAFLNIIDSLFLIF